MIWAAVIGGSLACYLVKLAGLSVPDRLLNDERVQRAAALLPIALLTALTLTQTFSTRGMPALDIRGLAVGAALVAVLVRAPFLVAVIVAAVVAAAMRLVVT